VETFPETGTVQGSTLSPLLANVYLHYVLDLWFELEIKPQLRGKVILVRYCDDFVMGFERQEDAYRVNQLLGERLVEYGLELHPEKTRMVDFRRPPRRQQGGKGPGTFDFLGFTHYWRRSRRGNWHMETKTRRARLKRAIRSIYDWCRRHRHESIPAQHQLTQPRHCVTRVRQLALKRKLTGHFNYFAVRGNSPSIGSVAFQARRAWYKWLRRRSQRSRLNWDRFNDLLRDFPLSAPAVSKSLWATNS
jgi:hypothetical protein